MATSNFHDSDASKIYAVLMNYDSYICDEDGNETDETETVSCDEYDYENLMYELKEAFKKLGTYSDHGDDERELRSFRSHVIGTVSESKLFLDQEVSVDLTLVIRSGYYEGANLDYNLSYGIYNSYQQKADNTNDIIDEFIYNADNKGMAKIQAKNVLKWLENTENKLREQVENIYESFSTPLKVVARFSNGETMYQKIE